MAAKKTATATPVAPIVAPEEVVVPVEVPVVPEHDFDIADPLIMKPQDLPLVVKPTAGKDWANAEQAEYARTVNGYAYKNPKKWAKKKAKLLANLQRLATDPDYINFLRGAEEAEKSLKFSNKLIES